MDELMQKKLVLNWMALSSKDGVNIQEVFIKSFSFSQWFPILSSKNTKKVRSSDKWSMPKESTNQSASAAHPPQKADPGPKRRTAASEGRTPKNDIIFIMSPEQNVSIEGIEGDGLKLELQNVREELYNCITIKMETPKNSKSLGSNKFIIKAKPSTAYLRS